MLSSKHARPPQIVAQDFLQDVIEGLSAPRKFLASKYFYDEIGSKLFDQICELPEYYLTRCELEIMDRYSGEIADQIGAQVRLIEFGSGSSRKTRLLLDALDDPVAYVPIDVSAEHLFTTAKDLKASYPDVDILPLVADFTTEYELPNSQRTPSHSALYFPGSTIGNFSTGEAGQILSRMAELMGHQGGIVLGIDLHKDSDTLNAAYNDRQGVTAQFNLNLLHRINRELDGSFEVENFAHRSVYNESNYRIETSIVSLVSQAATVGDREFDFEAGEEIHTENSHKYIIEDFAEFARGFGFDLHKSWTDEKGYFAVLHLVHE